MPDVNILTFNLNDASETLVAHLRLADVVYHLAGVNRPERDSEFEAVNVGLAEKLVECLDQTGRKPTIVFTSSIQATLENPYGKSKMAAEEILVGYGKRSGAAIHIYRLPNVFGKWCKPNYNSVVATYCFNISHGLEITVSDPKRELELVYIDHVVSEFCRYMMDDQYRSHDVYCDIAPAFRVTLGELAEKVYAIEQIRSTLLVPDTSDEFMKCLHATFISYLEKEQLSYPLEMKEDQRGWLAELMKSQHFGQIFVSKTLPGVVRGNHYHNSKVEKFCVVQGEAVIKFRHVLGRDVLSYQVSGERIEVVDIPPGYTHSLENVGKGELIVIFWTNQIFDPAASDTHFTEV